MLRVWNVEPKKGPELFLSRIGQISRCWINQLRNTQNVIDLNSEAAVENGTKTEAVIEQRSQSMMGIELDGVIETSVSGKQLAYADSHRIIKRRRRWLWPVAEVFCK